MGREAMETSKSFARKKNREKSYKLKSVTEHSVLVLWFLFFRWYITACLYAGGNMGMIQER